MMGRQILIVLIFRIEPEGTCTKEKRQPEREGWKKKERESLK